jgi:hypothetical protein
MVILRAAARRRCGRDGLGERLQGPHVVADEVEELFGLDGDADELDWRVLFGSSWLASVVPSPVVIA